ncbi:MULTISPECIES: MlaD family protein [unclassified Salipiger]|uniref:MlaD family protein n=1 Tax=unclassified Salipiger TaxID=2640570 RepID=UPI0013BD0D86|nr:MULTISPECIES: MlaD family protein [unclassified Salipiger]NDV49485.1 MCE family protein [Salipiger sp. PrR003]NDW34347.1 MCE family protein [Salipiger sp. PrR007]
MSEPKPAKMEIEPKRRSVWRNLSLVWLVPLAAIAVTVFIAWQSLAERGALIEITFENAAGITADDTTIRYRDVIVGTVEEVVFSEDLAEVRVSARIDRNVADSLPADAQFWVVRPEVSASGITGLSTVLSGVYIEAGFAPQEGAEARKFRGLDQTPLVRPGVKGTRITIRADDGTQLSAGAPIFYQGIEVGRIETPRLLERGNGVVVDAFIEAPNDRRITTATRFWDTSGFSVNIGPSGVNLSVGSVAALIRGGIAFDTVVSGGNAVPAGYAFDLYDDEASARDSLFSETISNAVELTAEFDESVRGLEVGSSVTYRGLRVGRVTAIGAFIDGEGEAQTVRLRTTLSIDPRALGLEEDAPQSETIAFLSNAVKNGLRARLASQNLFSQSLVVELAEIPDAEPATFGIFAQDAPLIPSVESDLPDITATAEGLFQRINDLPVEDLLDQAIDTLASIENFTANPRLRDAPDAVIGLLEDARGLIGSDEIKAIPGELRGTVAELRGVIEDMRAAGAVQQLVSTLEAAEAAAAEVTDVAGSVDESMAGVPDLLADLRALTQKATALDLESFLADAGDFLDGAGKLVDQDSTRQLPADLSAMLQEAQGALSELRAGGVIENTNATLASARDAAAAVEEAAATLPELSTRIQRLVAEAESVISGYDGNSAFNRQTVSALREVQTAAEALNKLARSIERNPNSLLFGR